MTDDPRDRKEESAILLIDHNNACDIGINQNQVYF